MRRGAGLLAAAGLLSAGLFSAGLFVASPLAGASVASADEAAPGTFTISASAPSIAPGDLAFISVHRTGGSDGVVSVSVDSAALPVELATVIAPIDTEVTFLDADDSDKTIPIVFLGHEQPSDPPADDVPNGHEPDADEPGDDAPDHTDGNDDDAIDDSGLGGAGAHAGTSVVAPHAVSRALAAVAGSSAPLTVSLSAPTGGASVGTPSSVSISVATPPTTTPVDGGSDTSGSAAGGTTTPGTTTKNSSGTTSPVGGGQSLADTGVDAILPFIIATLAAIAGLAALLVVRRRRVVPND